MMSKVEELVKTRARVQVEIEKLQALERRSSLARGAFGKLRTALVDCLTDEERQAVSGMYLFLHVDKGLLCVDMVREVPSATDKGQSADLEKVLTLAEEIMEARALEQRV